MLVFRDLYSASVLALKKGIPSECIFRTGNVTLQCRAPFLYHLTFLSTLRKYRWYGGTDRVNYIVSRFVFTSLEITTHFHGSEITLEIN